MTNFRTRRSRTALGAGVAIAGLALAGIAAPAQAAPTEAGDPIPPHVFAPYFFNDNPTDELFEVSQESGAQYMTLAFLETLRPGDCTVYWNGRADSPIGPTYRDGIEAIRAAGGDVFPSFGGARTGSNGTELADSCTDVNAIAREFIRVIEAYDFTRIDLDIEGGSLTKPGAEESIDRRNKAIKIVQDWAAEEGRTVEFVYTQPTYASEGLNAGSMKLLRSAVEHDVELAGVNIMTFDYYDAVSNACRRGDGPPHDMAAATISAGTALHGILADLYPDKSDSELWGMIGIIEMPGNSDFGPCEAFSTEDAVKVLNWAIQKDILALSFWVLQRDARGLNGAEPYQYSRIFAPFTHGDNEAQTTVTTTVKAGPLSLEADLAPVVLPDVTLDGTDQVVSGALGQVTVVDARGTGAGWSLTGQASDLRAPAGDHVLDAANLGWRPAASVAAGGDLAGDDVAVSAGEDQAPGSGLDEASTLCSATGAGSGGSFDCSADLDLGVPSNTTPGTYTGVLTLTLI
ncbi:glycosyl hydrolase family 18 protein [Pseudactinotalea sp. HY158]|uniref:glycosyl hydrolase family 18 protein n=1 Tax=Pseudactinotalea sp. HY158 TaxID=2654547 RepID=UPI00129CAC85|nr:glycosyl hydrolase family 18 protein [Pseudactinotalea sp. HY158]QGH69624.1 chitinase [Pseudactinotalea sp. HY158]